MFDALPDRTLVRAFADDDEGDVPALSGDHACGFNEIFMPLVRSEVRNQADEQVSFRQTEFQAKIMIGLGRSKMLDVQTDGKCRDTLCSKPVPFHQLAPRLVAAGH